MDGWMDGWMDECTCTLYKIQKTLSVNVVYSKKINWGHYLHIDDWSLSLLSEAILLKMCCMYMYMYSCNWVNEEVDVSCISMVINKTKAKKAAAQPCYRHYLESTNLTVLSLWSMNQDLLPTCLFQAISLCPACNYASFNTAF